MRVDVGIAFPAFKNASNFIRLARATRLDGKMDIPCSRILRPSIKNLESIEIWFIKICKSPNFTYFKQEEWVAHLALWNFKVTQAELLSQSGSGWAKLWSAKSGVLSKPFVSLGWSLRNWIFFFPRDPVPSYGIHKNFIRLLESSRCIPLDNPKASHCGVHKRCAQMLKTKFKGRMKVPEFKSLQVVRSNFANGCLK